MAKLTATQFIKDATCEGTSRRSFRWVKANLPSYISEQDYEKARKKLIDSEYLIDVGSGLEPRAMGTNGAIDLLRRVIHRGEPMSIKKISKLSYFPVATLNVAFAYLHQNGQAIKIEGGKVTSPASLPEPKVIKPKFKSFCPINRALQLLEQEPGLRMPEIVARTQGDRPTIEKELHKMVRDGEAENRGGHWYLLEGEA